MQGEDNGQPEQKEEGSLPAGEEIDKPLTVKQDLYLNALLLNSGNKTSAALAAGVSYRQAFRWHNLPHFKAHYEMRKHFWISELEAHGLKRAKDKSDLLLMFFLKAMDRERYDDNIARIKYLTERGLKDSDDTPQIILQPNSSGPDRDRNEI